MEQGFNVETLTPPTQAEIDARFEDLCGGFLSMTGGDLAPYVSFDLLRKVVKPEVTDDEVRGLQKPLDRAEILKEMADYMAFAWEKANNCRGLSAGRSMQHYANWILLLGDREFLAELDPEGYSFYGKDKLVAICERYGWDHTQWDDGIRANNEEEAWEQRQRKEAP